MELPQPRPFGAPQGRKPTHDFLSLYSPAQHQHQHQQDPTPTSGAYLKTHDFLQPLERVGKNVSREGNRVEVTSSTEKSLPPAAPAPAPAPSPSPPTTTVEHILPGGIGTYSISHISYISQSQRVPKPGGNGNGNGNGNVIPAAQSSSSDKNDDNSNCSSYTGSGFTLWEESAVNKGKTGKENIAGNRHVISEGSGGIKMGGMPWMTLVEPPSHSSSIHHQHSTTISSLSSSHPSSAQKNQSFVDMLKSAKSSHEDEDDDGEEFVIKKEPSSHQKGVLSVKIDTVNADQKPSTPRSKHSATEQRRRSKINDRFSMLRELIPHGDQKRDKASFLLEVIEYIQFLQEKVHKYEDSYRGWNDDPPKTIPWNNSQRPTEAFMDQPRVLNGMPGPALVFAAKLEENNSNIVPNIPKNGQNLLDSAMSSLDTVKEICQHPRLTNKVPPPFSVALQPNICAHGCGSPSAATPLPSRLASVAVNTCSQSQPQLWPSRFCTTDCTTTDDKLKDQELTIESGTISISTIYSQGLLSTLTQALQSSGVDLSQASISVQIDLGNKANASRLNSSTPVVKKDEIPSMNEAPASSRLARSRGEENDKTFKRLKTSRN